MKNIILAIITAVVLTGCAAFETLGDYINENEVFTSIATRQAVARYIAAGDTLEAETRRAKQVEHRLEVIKEYVKGNPRATVDGLLAIVDSSIDWDGLQDADKLLVKDILTLLKGELDQYKDKPELSENAQVAIIGLFDTAISAARIYLMRG